MNAAIPTSVSFAFAALYLAVRPATLRNWVFGGLLNSRLTENGERIRLDDLIAFEKPISVFGGER